MNKKVVDSYSCNDCQAGVMRLQQITYFTWLGEELVTVPNFPAWVCDICGRRDYDERAIAWLTTMLNPETGKSSGKPPHRRGLPVEKRDAPRPMKE